MGKGVDDAPASYVTDFLLGIFHLGIFLGFQMLRVKGDMPLAPFSTLNTGGAYFFFAGLSSLTVGVVRVQYPHSNDYAGSPAGWEINWKAHLVCMGLSGAALALCAYTVSRATLPPRVCARSVTLAGCLVVALLAGAGNTGLQLLVGAHEWVARGAVMAGCLALGLASAVRAAQGQMYAGVVLAGACALSVGPLLFRGSLETRCGAAGEGDCPLSGAFNHNAIANVIAGVAAGFTAMGVALVGLWEPLRGAGVGAGSQVGPEWVSTGVDGEDEERVLAEEELWEYGSPASARGRPQPTYLG